QLALEKLRTTRPDAIFMDLLLPYVKGVEVIKQARRHPHFASRPIYVCTSAARMAAWTRRGNKAGATKIFDKAATPIDDIIAEVAADLLGRTAKAAPAHPELPGKAGAGSPTVPTRANVAGPRRPQDLFAQNKEKPRAAKFNPFISMKSFLKTIGLAKTTRAVTPPAKLARPAPIPAAQQRFGSKPPHAAKPAVGAMAREFNSAGQMVRSGNEELQQPVQAAEAEMQREALARSQQEREQLLARISSMELELKRAQPAAEQQCQECKRLKDLVATKADEQREALARSRKEREELTARISSKEVELKRAQAAAEQHSHECKRLTQRLNDLAATKADEQRDVLAKSRQEREELTARISSREIELTRAQAAAEQQGQECKR